MYFYYFMMKRYRRHYQQVKCILHFFCLILPTGMIITLLHQFSFSAFHASLFLAGWISWTFLEYILHRFWMHSKNSDSPIAKTHHHHHTHPTELIVTNFHRLLMAVFLAGVIILAVHFNNYFTYLAGLCFGMEGYFLMHQVLHLKVGQALFKRLVRYHMYHHCKYPNACFGISVPWWDDLFKTVPASPKITQRIIDFYFNGDEKEGHHSLLSPSITLGKTSGKTNTCSHDCAKCNAGIKNRRP